MGGGGMPGVWEILMTYKKRRIYWVVSKEEKWVSAQLQMAWLGVNVTREREAMGWGVEEDLYYDK